jgi:dTDP-4-amino-4,6-dideoxygalactose transaminase
VKVPFMDLSDPSEEVRQELRTAVERVLNSGHYILGSEVSALEQEVPAYCGTRFGVAVGNGTDALVLSLYALGVGKGDEVITSPFTFFATVEAILQVGAVPVFADVDPHTFTITAKTVEARITRRTKAILPVHIFGLMADMPGLLQLAKAYRLLILEDACQAIGATWEGNGPGFYGNAATLSFFPTKNLGGCGDGGMILTQDAGLAQRLRRLRVHGSVQKYVHEEVGWNSRLDEIQAALLRVKLRKLDEWTERRRSLARRYDEGLRGLPLQVPVTPEQARHVYHLYTIVTEPRDALKAALAKQGIETQVYYPLPMHLQPALRRLGYQPGDFPVAEHLAEHCLSLPLYPWLRTEQQDHVIESIRRFSANGES